MEGTVRGCYNDQGQVVFCGSAEITCAEAAVIIDRLLATGKFELRYPELPFLCEFTLRYKESEGVAALRDRLSDAGFLLGVPVAEHPDEIIIAATEQRTPEEIERLIQSLS